MRALALLFSVPAAVFAVASLPACGEDAATDEAGGVSGDSIPVDVGSSGSTSSAANVGGGPAGSTTSGAVTPPPPPEDVDLTTVNTSFEGKARNYMLGLPKGYDAKRSYPLVMLFHGNPGSKEQMRGYAPFERVTKRDAILVYPSALDGAWDLYTPTETNKDMAWIRALPAELAGQYNVDQGRVYGFGFSGGAFMMAQMSCRFGQSAFHAVYINSGGGPQEDQMGFPKRDDKSFICPGGPIPTMVVHGDVDGQVVKASGQFTASSAAKNNGCTDFPKTPVNPSPCLAAAGCQKAAQWCLVPKLGHGVWDQGMQAAWAFFNAN